MRKDDFVYQRDNPSLTGVVEEMFTDGTAWVFWHQGHFHTVVPTNTLCTLSAEELDEKRK